MRVPAAFVRVRPALAGEGRYFVRVPPGTNAANFQLQRPQQVNPEALGADGEDGLGEAERTALFLGYLHEKEAGYDGTFGGGLYQSTAA
jgi:hypothetical protein